MLTIKELDLRSVRGFIETVDWIRQNLILRRQRDGVLQLDVKVSRRTSTDSALISLFVETESGYVFAFRGQDKTYVLGEKSYLDLLEGSGVGNMELLRDIGVDHRSLGTFRPAHESTGLRGRSYTHAQLQDAERLSRFRTGGGPVTKSEVSGAVSTLVCMLSESARWPSEERNFEKIYFGFTVQSSLIFKVYDKAKRIVQLASVFPNYSRHERIEKLVKRADEMLELLEWLRGQNGRLPSENKALINLCLDNKVNTNPRETERARRVCEMCKELKADVQVMAEIILLCGNELAVRGAYAGPILD